MQFHIATINSWKHLLKDDGFKDIIINCLEWLSANNRCAVHGFVIMPNHIHLLWTIFEQINNHPRKHLPALPRISLKRKY